MAAAILPPQNSLQNRSRRVTLTQPHSAPNPRTKPNRSSYAAPVDRRRKRWPVMCRSGGGGSRSQSIVVESPAAAAKKNLVMGQVRILKRGETLSSFQKQDRIDDGENTVRPMMMSRFSEDFDLFLGTTDRLGPDPEKMQKQIGDCERLELIVGFYAGAGYSLSPPPSSLPIPGFLGKNKSFV